MRQLDQERDLEQVLQLRRAAEQSRRLTLSRQQRVRQVMEGVRVPSRIASPEQLAAHEAEERLASIERLRAFSGIGEKFLSASLWIADALPEDFRPEYLRVATLMSALLEPSPRPRLIILVGAPGLAKTHVACAVLLALVERGQYVRFDDARNFADLSRAAWFGTGVEKWERMKQRYTRAALVCLDELPAAIASPTGGVFLRERAEQVLNDRYASNRDSIITGNSKPEAVRALIGDRLADRAEEAGGILVVNGESVRGRLLDGSETPSEK